MRFSVLSQVVLVSLAAFGRADLNCDDGENKGPFAPSVVAGPAFPEGDDPETKCDTHWETGEIIVGIEVWTAKFQVKAVKFKFSQSGWGPVRGSIPDGNAEAHEKAEWDASQEVGIRLWNNKPDDGDPMDAVGRIVISQGGADILDVGANSGKVQKDEIVVDSGAGLMLGAKTRSGAWLSSLEFKMLKSKVASAELANIELTEDLADWNEKQKGIDHINLADVYFVSRNPVGGPNLTYTFTNTDSRDVRKTISSQRTNQWTTGVKLTIGGGVEIPLLAEAKVDIETSFQYQRTNMDGTETSESTRKDLSIALGSPGASNFLPPQRASHCTSMAVEGRFDSDYTALVTATLADGSIYSYHDAGGVTTVGWVKADTSCEEIDIKDVPSNAYVEEPTTPARKRAVVFRG